MKTLICAPQHCGDLQIHCPKCLTWRNVNCFYTCEPLRVVTSCESGHVYVLCLAREEFLLFRNDPRYTPDSTSCVRPLTSEQAAQYSEKLADPASKDRWYSVGVTEMSKSEMNCTECGRIFHLADPN